MDTGCERVVDVVQGKSDLIEAQGMAHAVDMSAQVWVHSSQVERGRCYCQL